MAMDLATEYQKEIKRQIVNRELMMLHGHDVTGYLPPLPRQNRTPATIALAWSCDNPAMRQLGNIQRRGPRNSYLPVVKPRQRPKTASASLISWSRPQAEVQLVEVVRHDEQAERVRPALRRGRPHTAYTCYVRGVLNSKVEDEEPKLTLADLENAPHRRLAPPEDLEKLITPARMLARARDIDDSDSDSESEYHGSGASVGSLQRKPKGRFGLLLPAKPEHKRKKKGSRRKNQTASAEVKRLEMVMRVLRGDWEMLPGDVPTSVRVYLCANADDFHEERKAIITEVYPRLQEHCLQHDLDLHIVDLRWCGGDYIDHDLTLSGLHKKEITNCQRQSIGPCFVTLVGDKYGPVNPPPLIAKEEFEAIKTVAEESRMGKAYLLEEWYEKDENAIPIVYVLQSEPTGKSYKGKKVKSMAVEKEAVNAMMADTLQILQEAVKIAYDQGKMLPEKKAKYYSSVLDEEINQGLLQLENPSELCLAYFRHIPDIPTHNINDITMRFMDVNTRGKKPVVDETSQNNLREIKTNISSRLQAEASQRRYTVSLKEYILGEQDSDSGRQLPYIKQFSQDLLSDIKGLVDRSVEGWRPLSQVRHYKMYREVLQHARLCVQRATTLCGRRIALSAVERLVKGPTSDRPVALYGRLGGGKTTLMAKICRLADHWKGPNCVLIARFLGKTTDSSNVKLLLQSLCLQICIVYQLDVPNSTVMNCIEKLRKAFFALLEQVSKNHGEKQPLVIVLDGLDELQPAHRAHTLHWLPSTCPRHVYLIVGTDTHKHGIVSRLEKRLPENHFIMLDDLPEKTVEEIFVRMLQKRNRQLTSEQRDLLMRLSKAHPRPLFTHLMAHEALSWSCSTNIPERMLPGIVEDAIWRLLVMTENKYGPVLVQHFFSYLTIAPNGLTEVELRDALSCDQSVLEEVFLEQDIPLEEDIIIPSLVLARVLNKVKLFLTERVSDGHTLICFHHPIFKHVCSRKYFGSPYTFSAESEGVEGICRALADIFLQENGIQKTFGDSMKPLQRHVQRHALSGKNIRKLKILPYLISRSGVFSEVRQVLKEKCLCNFRWLLIKLQNTPLDLLLSDLSMITQRDQDIDLVRDFFMMNQRPLLQEPNSLAAQLLGCMPRLGDRYKLSMDLLEQALDWIEQATEPLMYPIIPSFPSVYDLCKVSHWGLQDVLGLVNSLQLGVVRTQESSIEVWDMQTGECVHQLGVVFDENAPNVYSGEIYVLSIVDAQLRVWEIESGLVIFEHNLAEIVGDNMSKFTVMAYTHDFDVVVLRAANDDCSQLVFTLDTRWGKCTKLTDFDTKDEFHRKGAVITDGGEDVVFVSGRSEEVEGESQQSVTLRVYSIEEKRYKHKINCDNKKVHSMILRDRVSVVICWTNASFDLYDIVQGSALIDMPAPSPNLSLHMARLNGDKDILFLATQNIGSGSCFSALWRWDVEDQHLVQLLIQEHQNDSEALTQFIVPNNQDYAIVMAPNLGKIYLWEVIKGLCVRTIEAHTQPVGRIVPTSDPFTIYSCSAGESVIKSWALHQLLPRFVTQKIIIPVTPILITRSTDSQYRRPGSRRNSNKSIVSKPGSAKSSKSVRFVDQLPDDDSSSIKSGGSSRRELVSVATDELMSTLQDPSCESESMQYRDELEAMYGITCFLFTSDSSHLITGSFTQLPTVWSTETGRTLMLMDEQSESDVGTPWFTIAGQDEYLVGLTVQENTLNTYPHAYHFQLWDLESGNAIKLEEQLLASACTVTSDKERAVITQVEDFDPTGTERWHVKIKVINLSDQAILQDLYYVAPAVPTVIQLTEDDNFLVTDSVLDPTEKSTSIWVFSLTSECDPKSYKFKCGNKYDNYRVTNNIVLKNGLSVAVGCHGDLQLWDVQTCEYEGNMFHDANVKDTRNPNLHNHNGLPFAAVVLSRDGRYLLCGSTDGTTSLWDLEEEILLHTYSLDGAVGKVCSVCISEDNELVLAGHEDGMVTGWKRSTPGQPLCRLYVHVAVTRLLISADNATIVAIGARRCEPPRMNILRLQNRQKAQETEKDK